MTQAVSNTNINLQEMMTQAQHVVSNSSASKDYTTAQDAIKKVIDFDKVYEKQVNTEEKQTLGDLKSRGLNQDIETNWADFTKILSKATGEANVETSLDLTLARDIDEIISQLKKAIDETVDETEDLVEKTVVVDELTTQNLTEEEVVENSETDSVETNELVIFEQLLTFINKNNNLEFNENKTNNSEVKTENLLSDIEKDFSESQSEIFENLNASFDDTEDFSNLVSDKTVKTDEENIDNLLEDLLDEDMLKELNIEDLEAESNNSGNNNFMDAQTPQEQAVKAVLNNEIETFEIKIDKTMNTQNIQSTQSKPIEINPSKILDQISKQLDGLQNNSKVNIVLNPEALGKVTVQLIKTGEGLSAQFTVANQEVRDMLMKGLDGLKEALTAQGVGVDNVSVRINDTQKSEYNADWTEQEGSRGGNKEQGRSNKEEKEKGLFEQMMAQNLNEENGNV